MCVMWRQVCWVEQEGMTSSSGYMVGSDSPVRVDEIAIANVCLGINTTGNDTQVQLLLICQLFTCETQ